MYFPPTICLDEQIADASHRVDIYEDGHPEDEAPQVDAVGEDVVKALAGHPGLAALAVHGQLSQLKSI
jgi:hypothetical protein